MTEFTNINTEKFTGDMQQLISDYYRQNITRISNPRFHDIMISDVTGQVIEKYRFESHNFELLYEILEEQHDELFNTQYCYFKRTNEHYIGNAYRYEFDQDEEYSVMYVSQKIDKIKEIAVFGNDVADKSVDKSWVYSVGKMIYENETGAKVGETGIIQHIRSPFIICEFDGIVENKESPLYGRIVKINNVQQKYNIGVPYEEDWIQAQLQMECCDLDFCDYVEIQIKEYETEEEFFKDKERTKGIILILQNNSGIIYKYMPLNIGTELEEIQKWMEQVYNNEYTFVKAIYWYLEDYEMTLIIRNQEWYKKSLTM
jgi:hypothetical protein